MSLLRTTPVDLQNTNDRTLFFERIRQLLSAAGTGFGLVKRASAVADLNQTIAGPSIAEVQAISDKVDELLAAQRAAGQLEP